MDSRRWFASVTRSRHRVSSPWVNRCSRLRKLFGSRSKHCQYGSDCSRVRWTSERERTWREARDWCRWNSGVSVVCSDFRLSREREKDKAAPSSSEHLETPTSCRRRGFVPGRFVVIVLKRTNGATCFASRGERLRLFDDSIGRCAGREKIFEHRLAEKGVLLLLLLLFVNKLEIQVRQIRVRRGEHCFDLKEIDA